MKKILMINTLPINNFGETNKVKRTAGNQTLYNTLKGYSENGYDVTMLTFCDVPKESKPFPNITVKRSRFLKIFNFLLKTKQKLLFIKRIRKEKSDKVTTDISVKGSTFLFKFWEVFGYLEGLSIAKKNKADLIYGYEIYSTRPSKRIADKIGVPSVSRFQGTELSFYLNEPDKFEKSMPYILGTKVPTDLVIMANDGTQGDEILVRLGVDINKVRFWVNGLTDKNKYLNYKKEGNYKGILGIPEDAFVICTANRFVDWKRIDRIIKVVHELTKKNQNVYLVAIGDGPEKMALAHLVSSLNLKNNVIFTGTLEHAETIYHIANADLYITLNEGGNLGNSVLEALALGTAVCTLRNNSVEKVLMDGYNAILFNTVDEQKISSQIYKLVENREMIENIKVNARNYAESKLLSWSDRMFLEVETISELIEKSKKRKLSTNLQK
ncbi:glycosyltransferase family 4 protein [Fictibacillus norfolkensis]|uniref:Glycosyltransferase family 4 protein n=1 Tax=Fictibacillus norfolkensis TaxID=2762233 RepID=A0ABR8SN42_9BACL|nr:glycosyltransferase family 4 protein [Fictibacillus norfolkensis]MBD7964910.1 glycosyltransferase family 4 protein [Fictibacillus norfolkensis]